MEGEGRGEKGKGEEERGGEGTIPPSYLSTEPNLSIEKFDIFLSKVQRFMRAI